MAVVFHPRQVSHGRGWPAADALDRPTEYGNSRGKSFTLEIKLASITDAPAAFWNPSNSRVQLVARAARLAPLNKIKKLDEADGSHRISYAFSTRGRLTDGRRYLRSRTRPPRLRKTYDSRHCRAPLPAANIKVFLSTGKNEADYAEMMARKPYAVVVNNVARFQRWRDNQ